MFESKSRNLIIPQSEHARLSAVLALYWGNDSFSPPRLPLYSFVSGVALHDRAYGEMDSLPVQNSSEVEWLKAEREAGIYPELSDPVTYLTILLHIKRLSEHKDTPERKKLESEIEEKVRAYCDRYSLSREVLEAADTITALCDSIAFDFAHEAPISRTLSVCDQNNFSRSFDITYHIDGSGTVAIDPWPFSSGNIKGYIFGFDKENYPDGSQPVFIPYNILAT